MGQGVRDGHHREKFLEELDTDLADYATTFESLFQADTPDEA